MPQSTWPDAGNTLPPRVERPIRNPPAWILLAVLAAGAVGTLVLAAGMTFYQDTWAFLIDRQDLSADALFQPHNEHLVVFPALIEMALIRIFGMSSALPEYVLLTVFLVVTALLLYVYMRRRVGQWAALVAIVIVFTLGPAWEVLLWPFEITFIGPILFGIAMLLALERKDHLGDLAACAFLTLAVGFSGLGICFIPAAAVAILQGERRAWLRRAYVFVVPLLLYAAWWVGWGHDAESHVTLRNIVASPRFVYDSLAWSLQSMLGLGPGYGGAPDVSWGRALLVGAVLLLGYWLVRRRPRPNLDPGLWPILAAALANWFLTAFNDFPGRDPSASRYQYAGVIFVLMIASNLMAGTRPGRRTLIVLAAVALLAIGPNLVTLNDGRNQLKAQSVLTRADTGALEIAARRVDPEFQLTAAVAGTPSLINITAAEYLEAADEHGSPAYSPEELAAAPEAGRRQADIVLSRALGLYTEVQRGEAPRSAGACVSVPAGGAAGGGVPLAPGATRIEVAPGPDAAISLRRFAVGEFPVKTEGVPGGSVMILRIPRDGSSRSWRLQVSADQAARVCR